MSDQTPDNQEELKGFFNTSSTEIKDYLQRVIPLLRDLPIALRSSDPSSGLHGIGQVTEGLSLILEYLQAAQALTFLSESAGNFAMFERNLGEVIVQMASAMEQQDAGLMADIVEYELVQQLDDLHQEITKIHT